MDDELLACIVNKAVIFGRFKLPTGEISPNPFHVDLRTVTFDARMNRIISRRLLEATSDLSFDAAGGMELGAVPVACGLMAEAATGGWFIDTFAVRKKRKGTGTRKVVEGPDLAGKSILIVEDTCNSGRSALAAVEAVNAMGARVVGVATVVARGGFAEFRRLGLPYRFLYSEIDISEAIAQLT